jgi:hypothetical protein
MSNSSLSKSIAAVDQKVSISAGSEPKVLDDHNLGPTKSPTFVGETLTGLTASLPVFSGASKELVSKSVVNTQTALGITALGLLANGAANYKTFMNAAGNAPEWASGIKVVTLTRAMDAATGSVSTTGVGFKPSLIIFISGVDSNYSGIAAIGVSDGSTHRNISNTKFNAAGDWMSQGYAIGLLEAVGKNQTCTCTLDADGFTLSWTRTGATAAANVTIAAICFR